MKNIAIIPARSGSKGLPDKNILPLNGVPLMAYTIRTALQSGMFDTVMVSTDSEEYAQIARSYGAQVPFLRSEATSGDNATSWSVVNEVLDRYKEMGKEFDTFALLQVTSPLRIKEHLEEAYAMLEERNAKTVVSVCNLGVPLESAFPLDENSQIHFQEKPGYRRRQVCAPGYRCNGSMYICRVKTFNPATIYLDCCYAYIMEKKYSHDIDELEDFQVAEALIKHLPEFQNMLD